MDATNRQGHPTLPASLIPSVLRRRRLETAHFEHGLIETVRPFDFRNHCIDGLFNPEAHRVIDIGALLVP